MWIITVHSNKNVKMFEFETEQEAKLTFEEVQGCKFLTEVVYLNNRQLTRSKIYS
ncbi:hypothetical protein L2D08_19285 [Domibacillus sp. PGB-M46]|uniref:hypothetical protein n=1 Tax=Domibacillus sp. PGB-M46 TaxID=2910255 RepID=UPI001F56085C|nr:hypothetical protein [Domibacillus sp. PGB-M46]MCI2256486.1 hypothetical protein [Domibacillus sp. PGB-M46]